MTGTRTVYLCPLHPKAIAPCPCTRSRIELTDLVEPAAIGLWTCDQGHQIVGPPWHPGGNSCLDGCSGVRRVAVSVVPSRL